ncbi:hypothetical protein HY224_03005 [Candidatus Uhrbacteria bacterium]|nr:hypothetical protein [Candidatus Uhrbacteria bacterium]
MRVYFFSSCKENFLVNEKIAHVLAMSGIQIMSNLSVDDELLQEQLRQVDASGESPFSRIDGLVVEGSEKSRQINFLIASAISHCKPVLFLADQETILPLTISNLLQHRNATDLFTYKKYSHLETLKPHLKDFLLVMARFSTSGIPNIKFTLRITPAIDRYLIWKAQRSCMTKADLLRKLVIDRLMTVDEEYNAAF